MHSPTRPTLSVADKEKVIVAMDKSWGRLAKGRVWRSIFVTATLLGLCFYLMFASPAGLASITYPISSGGATGDISVVASDAAPGAALSAVDPNVFPDVEIPGVRADQNRLPHIPPKIWQMYLDYDTAAVSGSQAMSFISNSPSHTYSVLDAAGALGVVNKLAAMPDRKHVLPLFYSMSRRVLRADFLRYLILAIEGGVYSDIDTEMVKPLHDWVPKEYKDRVKLIVGLEADQSPPVAGTTYEVQFCQWTLASAPNHPTMWTMVDRILDKVQSRPFEKPPKDVSYSDTDVLEITGPAGWTEVVFAHLTKQQGSPVTWQTLTGMREPRLIGDTLILPIDGFATGVPHSGASRSNSDATMVKHKFHGAWKDNNG